jgi:DNA-directed RNA polymerase specialized sigma24 family protein
MRRIKLVLDKRRKAIRLAKELRRQKPEMSFQEIADVLNARGHRNTIGRPFNGRSVLTLLGEKRGALRELPLETQQAIVDGARAGFSHSRLAQVHGVSYRAVGLAVRRSLARSGGL